MTFIKKINKYLVENYPLVWNTRLLWMTCVGIIIHITFFLIGYNYVNSQEEVSLEGRLQDFYFDTPIVFIGALVSIIALLLWLVFYLQNNSFKSFYNIKKGTLFSQFLIIIFIIFINITQFYSFDQGLKLKIRNSYNWKEVDKDIKEFNRLSIFLLRDVLSYKIENKVYPAPFPLKSVKTQHNLSYSIDTTQPYFKYDKNYYQFYDVDAKMPIDASHSYYGGFQYRIVKDLSEYKKLVKGSLYNYSNVLYDFNQSLDDRKQLFNFYEETLNKKDEVVVEQYLKDFYVIAKKYQVKHNLNIKDWLYLLNTKNDFLYKELIEREKPDAYLHGNEHFLKLKEKYYRTKRITDTIYFDSKINRSFQDKKYRIVERDVREYFSEIPYCDLEELHTFFKNIHEAYFVKTSSIIVLPFIILSFILGLLIFLFKVTDIKTLLLSLVAASVVLILLMVVLEYKKKLFIFSNSYYSEYLISIFFALTILVLSIVAFIRKWNKLVTSILFSLGVFISPLLLLALIELYKTYIRNRYSTINDMDGLSVWLSNYESIIIILVWLLSIGLYTLSIRKWRALPE